MVNSPFIIKKLYLQIHTENNIHSEVLGNMMSEIKDKAIKKLGKSEETKWWFGHQSNKWDWNVHDGEGFRIISFAVSKVERKKSSSHERYNTFRSPVKESESLTVVHPVIPGESVLFIGETRGGIISLSNFR